MIGLLIDMIILYLGAAMVAVGAVYDVIAGIGMLRLPNFYTRLHAATIGAVGGAALPLFGTGLIALVSDQLGPYRVSAAVLCFLAGIAILLSAPTGSHILGKAAYRAGASDREPCIVDMGEER